MSAISKEKLIFKVTAQSRTVFELLEFKLSECFNHVNYYC